MQLKRAGIIGNSKIRNSGDRLPHEVRNEVHSETLREIRNVNYSALYCTAPAGLLPKKCGGS